MTKQCKRLIRNLINNLSNDSNPVCNEAGKVIEQSVFGTRREITLSPEALHVICQSAVSVARQDNRQTSGQKLS